VFSICVIGTSLMYLTPGLGAALLMLTVRSLMLAWRKRKWCKQCCCAE
jgi:hypothetical protein